MGDKIETLMTLEEKITSLEEENKEIKKKHQDLVKTISEIKKFTSEVLECARNIKTGQDVMHIRAEQNKPANKDLEEWKKTCEYNLEKAKKENKGFTVSSAMIAVMCVDSRSEKIPWAHYDFINQNIYYSCAALKLLKIENTKIKSNLRGLLNYIKQEYRRGIEESLRSGQGLKHYKAKTSMKYGKKTQDLVLSTYPFYDNNEKAIGTAIFLQDPKISLHSRGIHKFEKDIQKTVNKILEQIKEYTILSG